MEPSLELSTNNRIGLHYFPDTLHYRARDLEIWLPQLSRMGMGWLTLLAPLERAIPEFFLEGCFSSGLQPVLHFQIPTQTSTSIEELCLLFRSYARWGVQYVALYDRPNSRSNWSPSAWAQMDLVERFLDQYVPLAEAALDEGLLPIFPPLEPGGDYWDLSFLQSALRGLQRRGQNRLLDSLALGAYAWAGNRSLEWGAGGPERWSQVVPYSTPADCEDQRGFRIFDWYLAISQRELGKRLPLFLLRVGSTPGDHIDPGSGEPDYLAHAGQNLSIARLLANEPVEGCSPVPPEVMAANFWLLAAHPKSPFAGQSWFKTEEEKLPVVNSIYRLAARQDLTATTSEVLETSELLDTQFIPGAVAEVLESSEDPAVQNSDSPAEQPCADLESSPEPEIIDADPIEAVQPLDADPEPICEAVAAETASLDDAVKGSLQPEQPEFQHNQPEQLGPQLEQQEPQSDEMELQPEQPELQQNQLEQPESQLEQPEPLSDQMELQPKQPEQPELQPEQPELQQNQPEQLGPQLEQQEPQSDRMELQPDQPEPQPAKPVHSISHYVLLPLYAWGAADWDLEVIQPFLQESHPTVGFSLTEARLASRVTVVGGDGAISAEALDMLRAAGCKVERVMDDGTLVAS